MNYINIKDSDENTIDNILLSIKTDATENQIKKIKKATIILWNKVDSGVKYLDDISFLDGLDNGDWNEIFIRFLEKLKINFELIEFTEI